MLEIIKIIADSIMELDNIHPFFAKIYAIIFIIWIVLLFGMPFLLLFINNKLGDIKDLLKEIKNIIKDKQ